MKLSEALRAMSLSGDVYTGLGKYAAMAQQLESLVDHLLDCQGRVYARCEALEDSLEKLQRGREAESEMGNLFDKMAALAIETSQRIGYLQTIARNAHLLSSQIINGNCSVDDARLLKEEIQDYFNNITPPEIKKAAPK